MAGLGGRPARCPHAGRGRRPGGQRPAGRRAPVPRARHGTDRAHRRRGHRRRGHAQDPGRHRRRDGHAARAGPLRDPARALRVVVPKGTSGVPAPKAALEWPRPRQLSSFRAEPAAVPASVRPARGQAASTVVKVAGNHPRTGAQHHPYRPGVIGYVRSARSPTSRRSRSCPGPSRRVLEGAISCAASVTRRGAVRLRLGFHLRKAGAISGKLVEVRPGDLRRDGGGVIAAPQADSGRSCLPGAWDRAYSPWQRSLSQILRGPEQGAQVTASLRTLAARASHGQLGPRVLSDACLISRRR